MILYPPLLWALMLESSVPNWWHYFGKFRLWGLMEESRSLGACRWGLNLPLVPSVHSFCLLSFIISLHHDGLPHHEPRTSGAKDYGLKSLKTRVIINPPCLKLVLSGILLQYQWNWVTHATDNHQLQNKDIPLSSLQQSLPDWRERMPCLPCHSSILSSHGDSMLLVHETVEVFWGYCISPNCVLESPVGVS